MIFSNDPPSSIHSIYQGVILKDIYHLYIQDKHSDKFGWSFKLANNKTFIPVQYYFEDIYRNIKLDIMHRNNERNILMYSNEKYATRNLFNPLLFS